ncbi:MULTISPECIES: hypothetical protein [Pseudomonadota]|jgi:hypothetical protein|uniref:hypothetical protein n=1 Tax=Pseudomonadota TaxID=1224 RepID=UPI00311E2E71
MGGGSKSSNKTTNNTTNYSLQGLDNAETAVAGNNNTVTVSDHGAIDAAFGFGENALELSGKVVDSNTDLSKHALDQTLSFSKSLVDQNTANAANSTLAIKELANSVATGGGSDVAEQSTKMVYTIGAVFAVVLLGFVIMLGSRKR